MQTNNELALFTLTTPTLDTGLNTFKKINDAGAVVSMKLVLEKRKEVAARLGLTSNKGNAPAIDTEINRVKDAFKAVAVGEFMKAAASDMWTGSGFGITRNKAGKSRMSMSIESRVKVNHTVSDDQLAKALAGLSDDQVKALLLKAAEITKAGALVAELKDAATPEAPALPAAEVPPMVNPAEIDQARQDEEELAAIELAESRN